MLRRLWWRVQITACALLGHPGAWFQASPRIGYCERCCGLWDRIVQGEE